MNAVITWLKSEPVRAYSIVLAAITLAASFGFDITAAQQAALLALAAVVLGVGSQAVRAQVTPMVNLPPGDLG